MESPLPHAWDLSMSPMASPTTDLYATPLVGASQRWFFHVSGSPNGLNALLWALWLVSTVWSLWLLTARLTEIGQCRRQRQRLSQYQALHSRSRGTSPAFSGASGKLRCTDQTRDPPAACCGTPSATPEQHALADASTLSRLTANLNKGFGPTCFSATPLPLPIHAIVGLQQPFLALVSPPCLAWQGQMQLLPASQARSWLHASL